METKFDRVKKFVLRKRIIIPGIFVLIILAFMLLREDPNLKKITIDTARTVDLKQTVLGTGQVVSATDLDLSFNATGVVRSLRVKVGDKVKQGTILASLDGSQALASLTQARGALAAAQARLKKTLEGASNEEVILSKVALENAKQDYENTKRTQDTLVKNAYDVFLNSTPEALPEGLSTDYTAPIISGSYTLGKEGTLVITTYNNTSFSASGLVSGSGTATTSGSQPIGNSGLYISFPAGTTSSISKWIISIPNKKATNYSGNYNAYQSALKTQAQSVAQAQSLVDQRTAELAIKQAGARGSDVDLARADIISAEGQVQVAQAKYEDTILRAPADGTITSIDIKLGELSEVQKKIITLQDVSNLYIEAKINESNIATIALDQPVTMTFDAFGPAVSFTGKIVHIDPSAITNDGIVNYKVKASIETVNSEIRSGMNADISILTGQKPHVVVIPKAAVVTKDGKNFVNFVTDKKHKKYKEQEVGIGLLGDGNLVEIVSGLSDGEDIAIVSNS